MGILDKVSKSDNFDVNAIKSRADKVVSQLNKLTAKLLEPGMEQILKDLEALGVDTKDCSIDSPSFLFDFSDGFAFVHFFISLDVDNDGAYFESYIFIDGNCKNIHKLSDRLAAITKPFFDKYADENYITSLTSDNIDEFEAMVKKVMSFITRYSNEIIDATEDCLIEQLGL